MKRKKFLLVFLILLLISAGGVYFLLNARNNNNNLSSDKKYDFKKSLQVVKLETGFPLDSTGGSYQISVVVDDIMGKEISLGQDYYSIASIKASYFDSDANKQNIFIPIAAYNKNSNLLAINGKNIKQFDQDYLKGGEKAWSTVTGIKKGQIISVMLIFPEEKFVKNSMSGFGFETAYQNNGATYTQENLNNFYQTGNPKEFKNQTIWPVVHIYQDSSLNQVSPEDFL